MLERMRRRIGSSAPPAHCVPTLVWDTPVLGERGGYVKDIIGRYTVLKERQSDGGYAYLAFDGHSVLGPSCASAEAAKRLCGAHHQKSHG